MPNSRDATGGPSIDAISQYHKTGLQSALSTQIKILAKDASGNKVVVGAIQSLAPTETRALIRISEVGTDGVIEIVPQSSATVELTVNRIVFDYQRLPASFQKGFRHIHSARLPFDIVVEDYNAFQEVANVDNAGKSGTPSYVTVYKNCWITSYGVTYSQDNFLITETATIWAEHVYDETPADLKANTGTADEVEVSASSSPTANALTDAHSALQPV